MKGVLFLSGGGDAEITKIVDIQFLNHLKKKIVYFIPLAKTAKNKEYRNSCKWLFNKLNNLSSSKVTVSLILDFTKVFEIENNTAVYLGGGNTYKLLKLMNDSGFITILKKFIYEGGTVYGTSAGAVLMGKNISTFIDDKYLETNKQNDYNIIEGFSLIGNYSILTHFHEGDEVKLLKYFDEYNHPVIAIPEGSGLLVKANNVKIIGSNGVYIFEKNKSKKNLSPNESISLF